MKAPVGTFENPAFKSCWETCQACYRCSAKGSYAKCNRCSGRFDMYGVTVPDPEDYCTCTSGVLRYKTKEGLVLVPYRSNPFEAKVMQKEKLQDEEDWNAYLGELRERFQNPDYDPIQVVNV